ncbi:MAG: sugar phosphate isomerase/epimerase [Sphingobacteriales bacterium]|nr:MAG: sugar phosphate isomerase/epimerase [Sphingobacteriales bacterium]
MKLQISIVAILLSLFLSGFQREPKHFIALGIVAPIEKDSLVSASGFGLIGESVGRMIAPSLSEEKFKLNLKAISKLKTKLYMCNVMFPGQMKIAGPNVKENVVLDYVDSLFQRAQQAKITLIVLGSGTARRLPEDYDVKKATLEFASLCRKIAGVAAKYKVKIALENLQSKETNFLNTVKAAAEVVRLVDHPNFKLNADIFHMRREHESPESIINAKDLLIHCEIAEDEERTLPGIKGDDFTDYFKALKTANYRGPVFVEAGSSYSDAQLKYCAQFLNQQIDKVYKN